MFCDLYLFSTSARSNRFTFFFKKITMSNIHGLNSNSSDDNKKKRVKKNGWTQDDASRLVQPPDNDHPSNSIFAQAQSQRNASSSSSQSNPSDLPPVQLTFWSNGFQVNDGPLREPTDDANKNFMTSVQNGRCPAELMQGQKVPDINLVDKRSEQHVAPPPPLYTAFSGGGHTMSPSGSGSKTADMGTIFTPSSTGASKEPDVDASAPTCRISIRTADGKRIVGKFNLTHTIHDLQLFIDSQGSNNTPYQLLLGRPPKPIEISNQTLEEAGLKNQSLMQKLA